jgi:hypothetical protein
MNEIDVLSAQAATEEAVVRLLRATRANDAEDAKNRHARHSKQTDRCPAVARFSAVLRCGGAWTADEATHVAACPHCKRVYDLFVANIAAVSEAATIVGREGDTLMGRGPAAEETTVIEGRTGQPKAQAAADDTITDDKHKKKKRG